MEYVFGFVVFGAIAYFMYRRYKNKTRGTGGSFDRGNGSNRPK